MDAYFDSIHRLVKVARISSMLIKWPNIILLVVKIAYNQLYVSYLYVFLKAFVEDYIKTRIFSTLLRSQTAFHRIWPLPAE